MPRAVAAQIKNPLQPLGVTSLVIDSNAAIALQKQAAGLPLQAGEIAILNRLKQMGDVDLRVAGNTVAEIRDGQINFNGFPIEVARSSTAYQSLLKVLEGIKLVREKGVIDRQIVADTFFAITKSGEKPSFATMDNGIYNPLLKFTGIDPQKLGSSVPEKFPNGFKVTILGRTIRVIPLPRK